MKIKKVFCNPWIVVDYLCARHLLNWVPDDTYLKLLYRAKTGKRLHLDNPRTFNEKIQWLKLFDRKTIYTTMVDKYVAKQYVADCIGEEYIIPTLGVWDKFEDIDFKTLPDQFVLKCTHDSGGLVICRDKDSLDKQKAKEKIERSLKRNYYWSGREWQYKDVNPRIIAEQYIEDTETEETLGLTDYKFFCFNNEVKMLYVSRGLENHATASISFYDLNGNEMPFRRKDYKPLSGKLTLPNNYNDMLEKARILAKSVDAPFVRIDLYSIAGKTKFSEITFSPCSGMIPFEPTEWDDIIGSWLRIPLEKK